MLQKRKNVQDSTIPKTKQFINFIFANREQVEKCLESVDPQERANILTIIANYLTFAELINFTLKTDNL